MIQHSQHIDRVLETTDSPKATAMCRLAASWYRSVNKHGLFPGETRAPFRVGPAVLRDRQNAMEPLLAIASPALDQLFTLVGKPGCSVLLTDAEGVVMDQRSLDADARTFEARGLWPGTVWSEEAEGTNGVGTCLAENRQIVIRRDQHFYARNTGISCIDAPIYGSDGALIGALDVTSARYDQTPDVNRLIAALVAQAAQRIEAATLRAAFPGARIVVTQSSVDDAAALLAIDGDDLVIGATREARRAFELGQNHELRPIPAADLLDDQPGHSGLAKGERAVVLQALARSRSNVSEAARQLGIGRATLYRRMDRLGIKERPN